MQARPYLNIRDMMDGGGAGRSGQTFRGGGFLSELGNNMLDEREFQRQLAAQQRQQVRDPILGLSLFGNRPSRQRLGGYDSLYAHPRLSSYSSIGDMFDGGGPGQSGGEFRGGGLLSAFLNTLGE